MRREGEVKISDLILPLHVLEQLSHSGREKALQHWKRPGMGWSPSTTGRALLFLCFPAPGCTAGYHSCPQKERFSWV